MPVAFGKIQNGRDGRQGIDLRALVFPQWRSSSGGPPDLRTRFLESRCYDKVLVEAEWLPHLPVTIGDCLRRNPSDLGAGDGDDEK